jgi:hypothetical protein
MGWHLALKQFGEPRVPRARVQYQGFLAGLGRAKTVMSSETKIWVWISYVHQSLSWTPSREVVVSRVSRCFKSDHMSSTKPIRRRNHRCDFEVGTSLCELFNSFKCRFVEDSSRWLWLCLCEVQTNIKQMQHVDRVVLKVFNQTPKKVTPNDGWWINSCSNWWLII